jgi:hypothetical protein
MIPYKTISKIMSGRGILFYSLRARLTDVSDEQLLAMIAASTVRMTPQVVSLIHANFEVHLNRGETHHYVFVYSGRDAQLLWASHMVNGHWEACQIVQPQRKAG